MPYWLIIFMSPPVRDRFSEISWQNQLWSVFLPYPSSGSCWKFIHSKLLVSAKPF